MIEVENYHKHTNDSNVYTPDSTVSYIDYFNRALEVGSKCITTTEHGWCGNNFDIYLQLEKFNKKLIKEGKNPLKFVFGGEFYWVKDRSEKDKSNCHIIILARNENGRKKINKIMSQCNKDGYYYKPRLDLDLIMSLPSNDVFITTACVAFWKYEDIDDIVLKLNEKFPYFFLEVQAHHTNKQRNINKHILELSNKYNIPLIAGMDSHMINENQAIERDDFLKSKKISYDDEQGWFMDYPNGDEFFKRFQEQGILSNEQIKQAIDNTLLIRNFEDIIYDKSIKVPTLYPNLNQEEKDNKFKQLINEKWIETRDDIPIEMHDKYINEIRKEVNEIIGCNMSDYFMTTYETIKLGIEKYGGQLTKSGRGSGCSEYINKLLGFTNVDRISARVTMYPERFLTKERILDSHACPDIDHNVAEREPFKLAQAELFGSAYDLIAFGTLKYKSAWKMYARAYDISPNDADIVSKQIDKYEDKLKHAERDELTGELLEEITIKDFVEEKYWNLLEGCKKYLGIKDNRKGHPCATICSSLNVEEEIGVILCKSESTGKEVLTACIESGNIDYFGWLKQDYLFVDVVRTTNEIYKRIGIKSHSIKELLEITNNDKKTWDIYEKGLTLCVNQVEQQGSKEKAMIYKPKNEVELSALIAGIRPSFASLIKTLINREKFDYNIPVLDNLIQTPEMPYTFILYQEQLMQILGFAGFPMKDTYDIVKSVSKKKTYCRECGTIGNSSMKTCPHCSSTNIAPLVDKYKEQFMGGLKREIGNVENYEETANEIWHIVLDFAGYGFNSSHSYCMALDSLNQAYLKAHYPLQFYEVMLRRYTDKGNKDKVKALKEEMKYFGIKLGEMKFGEDNRNFTLNEENNTISQSLVSIKGVSQIVADEIYRIANLKKYENFIDILNEIKTNSKIKSDQLNSLIEIGYFSNYGSINYLKKAVELYNKYYKAKVIKKDGMYDDIISKFANKSTERQFREIDTLGLINFFLELEDNEISTVEQIIVDHKVYGESSITDTSYDPRYCIALNIDTTYSPKILFYNIYSGKTQTLKINKKAWKKESFEIYDVICLNDTEEKYKKIFNKETGKWGKTSETEWWINDYWKVDEINE